MRLRSALAERYAVQRELGQGGSAVVYLAQDLRHSRPVAIKVLRPELAAIMGAERFLLEIETVARLQHPHILPLYDSGEAQGLLYFVMPFVAGESLRDLLEREKQLRVELAVSIARDVASALSFAHHEGVIHRDIKPENILLFGGSAVVADFGIARAIRIAGAGRITEANRIPGTPLYMSPEQTSGSDDLDGRSDIYSLGIVLYEMLGGEAPFTGFSPIEVMVHQIKDLPRPLAELRPSLPPSITLAIDRALAKNPADRFGTVTDFAEAIRVPAVVPDPVRKKRPRGGRLVAGGIAAAIALTVVVGRLIGDSSLDPARYAVLPFAEVGGQSPDGLRGEQTAMVLGDALSRWTDLTVVSSVLVSDALGAAGGRRLTQADAVRAARQVGAGRMVWGRVVPLGDSLRLAVGLYDVRHRARRLQERVFTLARDGSDLSAKIGALADSLVADRVALRFGAAPIGTAFREAWNHYAAGHSALARWNLGQAEREFGAAAERDPQFALAQLWVAQVRSWQRRPSEEWVIPARTAVTLASRLASSRDSNYALGLLALAEGRYQEACRRYRNRLDRDTTDVVALIGFGECNYRDHAVVRSHATPTGWAFRGSLGSAIRAYSAALQLAPAFNLTFGNEAYQRLSGMFFVEKNWFRGGTALPPDTGVFAAFPSLVNDTLAFVPDYKQAIFARPRPASLVAAVAANRQQLLQVVEKWIAAFPARAEPHEARALILELAGSLGAATPAAGTALGEIMAARRLATDSSDMVKYAATQVRLLLKTWQMDAARALADSLLRAWRNPNAIEAEYLAGLAALVGRTNLAAALAERSDSANASLRRHVPSRRIAADLLKSVRRFNAYAAFGGPRDSLVQIADRVDAMLSRYLDPRETASTWHLLMDDGLGISVLDMPVPSRHPLEPHNYLLEAALLLGRGDTAAARRVLGVEFDDQAPPGERAAVTVLQSSRLALRLGDTVRATNHLVGTLTNLAVAPTLLIDEPIQAAALVRALALTAELARRRGDTALSRRFAGLVVTLWSGCDPEWRPLLERMRVLRNENPPKGG